MKKMVSLALAGAVVFALSGCSTGDDGGPVGGMDTHYLTDVNGNGIGGVPYDCAVGGKGLTDFDGAYGFESSGDNCTLTFAQHATDKPVYIKRAEFGHGVSGLHYSCTYDTGSGSTPYRGYTDNDGHIKHVWGDNGQLIVDKCTINY